MAYAKLTFAVLSAALACVKGTHGSVASSPDGLGEPTEVNEVADLDGSGPPVDAVTPEADGGPSLTRDEIRLVVRAKLPQVRACFDEGLARKPDLGGRVVLRFTIGPQGRPDAIAVDQDELGDPRVIECLCEQLRS